MESFWQGKRVCVTGGAGFLGRAVCARLHDCGVREIVVPRRGEYDLTSTEAVRRLFDSHPVQVVIHLAAEVGGIGANQRRPGRFFYANLAMGLQLIEEARLRNVEKFVQVGTVCAYPKHCAVPFREDALWDGFPEETNAPYGIAKRALGVMLEAYRAEYGFQSVYVIPVNLYGPHDNFDLQTSHVIPAMIRKFCEAVRAGRREVVCWGTGNVSREFLYVDDAAVGIVEAAARLPRAAGSETRAEAEALTADGGKRGMKGVGERGIKGLRDRGSEGSRERGAEGSSERGIEGSSDRAGEGLRERGSEGSRDQGIKGLRDRGVEGSRGGVIPHPSTEPRPSGRVVGSIVGKNPPPEGGGSVGGPINLGTGQEIRIADLAALIARLCGYDGNIRWDASQPDGQPRRCLDVSRAAEMLEFRPRVTLEEGLQRTIAWYRESAGAPS